MEMKSVHDDPEYAEALSRMKGELMKLREEYDGPSGPQASQRRNPLSSLERIRNLRDRPCRTRGGLLFSMESP